MFPLPLSFDKIDPLSLAARLESVHGWTVGECGAGHTCVYANGAGNTCAPAGPDSVIVRPCISNGFWGGGNGPTCDGPTQTFVIKTD